MKRGSVIEAVESITQINTYKVVKKEAKLVKSKGTMMQALLQLQLIKIHILGQSSIKQWRNLPCSGMHCRIMIVKRH